MQLLNEIVDSSDIVNETITLPYDVRQKSRVKAKLDSGEEVSLLLPRGSVLRDGNILRADSGLLVKVIAAQESVSVAYASDQISLMKACYHLGNRHVPLQIDEDSLRYQNDHVLDAMVQGLGLDVKHELSAFEPESGAYAHH